VLYNYYGGEKELKVVTKQSLLERIIEEINYVIQDGREVDYIEVTSEEAKYMLRAQCQYAGPLLTFYGYRVKVVDR
jgi:hypothetical protein